MPSKLVKDLCLQSTDHQIIKEYAYLTALEKKIK